MEFNKELRPKVGLAVYILNEDKRLFLMKRQGAHGPGTWNPPGGHLEYQETFEECAAREAKEEADLDIFGIDVVGATNDIFIDESKHYITVATKAKEFKGEPKIMEPEKCVEIGWFDLGNLPQPLFLPVKNFFESNPLCLCGSGKKYSECHMRNIN